jgi:RHS repeat-associated protein
MQTPSKSLYANGGDNLSNISTIAATTALVSLNGNQTYIEVTNNGPGGGTGMVYQNGLSVQAGERYLVRVKGYRTGSSIANLKMSVTINGVATDQGTLAALPSGSTTESWIENIVSIPSGGTQLDISLLWPSVASGQKFYVNDFEIIKLGTNTSAPEYQYSLKDHLGNVRLTFTTKQDIENNTATLEAANLATEQGQFTRYTNARRVQSTLFDHTNGASTGYSERLNGGTNEKYGVSRSMSVMAGDTIKVQVYAKYADPNTANWNQTLTNLMSAIASNTGGIVVDGGGYSSSTSSFSFGGLVNTGGSSPSSPKAFLNWIIFDRDYNFKDGGFIQVSQAAKETGTDGPHEKLSKNDILIKEPGYIYIYLSNEETSPVEVFFDDLNVVQVKSPVVQTDDYYPFGLTFNSYQRENSIRQDYLYNGKERQDELGLDWLDYGARTYMNDIGRWMGTDRFADKYEGYSPYTYVLNNPVKLIDADGNIFLHRLVFLYFATLARPRLCFCKGWCSHVFR